MAVPAHFAIFEPPPFDRLHSLARVVEPGSGEIVQPGVLELQGSQLGGGHLAGSVALLRITDRTAIDPDRFLFICGRADNTIICGGLTSYCDDVADALHRHSAVREGKVTHKPEKPSMKLSNSG